MKKLILCFLITIQAHFTWADDIELYIGTDAQRAGEQPQVLIIFDTSGSMTTNETVIKSYDPDVNYPGNNGYVYYSYDSNVPSLSSSSRFLASDNGCNTSKSILDSNGFYLGRASYYIPQSSSESARWANLSGTISGASGHFIDCEDDVANNDLKNANGVIDGLPSNDNIHVDNPPPYATSPSSFPSFNSGIRFFSSNYVAWFNAPQEILKTRLEIAQETIVSLVESAPGVIFGLEVFNQNSNSASSGGRVVYGLRDEDNYQPNQLTNLVSNQLTANGFTPLCESLYEASRYLGGKGVLYGSRGGNKTPTRDANIINNNTYISPYATCTNEIFVILITDGVPVRDTGADSLVDALNPGGSGNRLDELAQWMHNNDINDALEGKQIATTYTIGFGEDAVNDAGALLNSTAVKGGGTYFPASNANDLLTALNNTLLEILEVSTSFTAPSVASNNFDRTETLDSIYYSMFLPSEGARWSGNLKKLRVSGSQQVDRDGALAVNSDGNISDTARTFWSTGEADGANVNEGGVAEALRKKTNRTLLSNLGSSDALVEFSYSNAVSESGDAATLAIDLGTDEAELENHFLWASGVDVDDEDEDGQTGDAREDIFGDPLHSRPLVINYGGSPDNQDIRIVVGTNAGFIHMFQDEGNTVDETWAFMPREMFDNIPVLRTNSTNADKVYGIDGTPTVHRIDINGDGTINTSDGDKVWLYFGLRRGGRSFYAIDISNPDSPRFMWRINEQSVGFDELAQTWSELQIGFSKVNIDSQGNPKPVAFFSAGYDTNKDSSDLGNDDSIGRGVYMIDAESGSLLFSATPSATSGKNLQWSALTDSIPGTLATLDSDSDGFIDRLYTSDTGGNVWRIDMPGDAPYSSVSPWTIHKLATLGDDVNIANDRRFFYEPTIARAILTDTVQTSTTSTEGIEEVVVSRFERRYDAILLGSGDRTSPTSTDTDDKFFMIKDPDIITRSFGLDGHVIPATITLNDLYDFTDNPYGSALSTQAQDTLDLAVSATSGWHIDYNNAGEKSVSDSVVIFGVAYFSSFTPAELSNDQVCSLSAGVGRLYAVDLARGSNIYNFRALEVSDRVLDTPTIIIPPEEPTEDTNGDGIIDTNDQAGNGIIRLVGAGSGSGQNANGDSSIVVCPAGETCVGGNGGGASLETSRTHLYITE